MSFNILGFVKEQLSGYVIGKMSDFLGENPYKTASALENVLPIVLGGLISKSNSIDGPSKIMDQIKFEGHNGKIFDRLNNLVKEPDEVLDWLASGASLSSNLFGDKLNNVVDQISTENDIRKTSSSSLLNFLSPLVLGALGKHTEDQNLDQNGLKSILASNEDAANSLLSNDIKSTLGLSAAASSVISNLKTAETDGTKSKNVFANKEFKKTESKALNLKRWIWPLLFLGTLLSLGYYLFQRQKDGHSLSFWKDWFKKDTTTTLIAEDSLGINRQNELDANARELAKTSTATADPKSSTKTTNIQETQIEGSTTKRTNRISNKNDDGYDLIIDGDGGSSGSSGLTSYSSASNYDANISGLATAIKNRNTNTEFLLNGISFVDGGYEFAGNASNKQLDQLANTLKRNPRARVFIQGFVMDGDSEDADLSQMRAEWIRYALIDRGIKANRIEARGHCTADMTHFKSTPQNGISLKLSSI